MHAYTKAWRAMSDMGFGPGPDGKWIQIPVEKGEPSASDVHVDKPVGKQPAPGSPPADPNAPPASTAPPGLGKAVGVPRCGNCIHFDPAGKCKQYNEYPVNAGMKCNTWEGAGQKFVPPAEVQAAAKSAADAGTQVLGITEALAKGDGMGAESIKVIADHFQAETNSASTVTRDAWGGAHAAKWAARVLKKLETPPPEAETTEKAEVDFEIAGPIVKVDAAAHLVFGWASIVSIENRPIVDTQGDTITPETIEDAAYAYVETSGKAGEMHEGKGVTKIGQLVESMVFTAEKTTSMLQSLTAQGINASMNLPFCGWWIGFRITSPEVWNRVVSGDLRAFSVGGRGKRAAFL